MKCPTCKTWTSVLETREKPDGTVRRRYECANLHRFTTTERAVPAKEPK
jgi:transcriptional regulator NrdR family protein